MVTIQHRGSPPITFSHLGLRSISAATQIRGQGVVPVPIPIVSDVGTPPDASGTIGKSAGATVAARTEPDLKRMGVHLFQSIRHQVVGQGNSETSFTNSASDHARTVLVHTLPSAPSASTILATLSPFGAFTMVTISVSPLVK